MASLEGGSSKERKGKKKHINKPTSKKYEHFKISGDKVARDKACPRCGPGIFLAIHNNRMHCGKCNYTSFEKTKA